MATVQEEVKGSVPEWFRASMGLPSAQTPVAVPVVQTPALQQAATAPQPVAPPATDTVSVTQPAQMMDFDQFKAMLKSADDPKQAFAGAIAGAMEQHSPEQKGMAYRNWMEQQAADTSFGLTDEEVTSGSKRVSEARQKFETESKRLFPEFDSSKTSAMFSDLVRIHRSAQNVINDWKANENPDSRESQAEIQSIYQLYKNDPQKLATFQEALHDKAQEQLSSNTGAGEFSQKFHRATVGMGISPMRFGASWAPGWMSGFGDKKDDELKQIDFQRQAIEGGVAGLYRIPKDRGWKTAGVMATAEALPAMLATTAAMGMPSAGVVEAGQNAGAAAGRAAGVAVEAGTAGTSRIGRLASAVQGGMAETGQVIRGVKTAERAAAQATEVAAAEALKNAPKGMGPAADRFFLLDKAREAGKALSTAYKDGQGVWKGVKNVAEKVVGAKGQELAQAGFWTTQIAPDLEQKYREKGMDPTKARFLALGVAMVEGAIENLNARQMLAPILKEGGAPGLLKWLLPVAEQNFKEMGEEWLQPMTELLGDRIAAIGDEKSDFSWSKGLEQVNEQAREAAVPVLLFGGPGAVSAGAQVWQEGQKKKHLGRLRETVQDAVQEPPVTPTVEKETPPPRIGTKPATDEQVADALGDMPVPEPEITDTVSVAPETEKAVDIGGMGAGIADAMYDAWDESIQETGSLPPQEKASIPGQAWEKILSRGYTPEEARDKFIQVGREQGWGDAQKAKESMAQFPEKEQPAPAEAPPARDEFDDIFDSKANKEFTPAQQAAPETQPEPVAPVETPKAEEAVVEAPASEPEKPFKDQVADLQGYVAAVLRGSGVKRDVEDATQNVMLKAMAAEGTDQAFDPAKGDLKAWVGEIARNEAAQSKAKVGRLKEVPLAPTQEPAVAPEPTIEPVSREQLGNESLEELQARWKKQGRKSTARVPTDKKKLADAVWKKMGDAEKAEAAAGFTTEQGSTYEWDNGKTTRTKSPHVGHEKTDIGKKRKSDRTVFVSPEDASEIGMHNALQVPGGKAYVQIQDDGLYLARETDGKKTWSKKITYTTSPQVGLSPVEFWEDGKNHPGNRIVSMSSKGDAEKVAPVVGKKVEKPEPKSVLKPPAKPDTKQATVAAVKGTTNTEPMTLPDLYQKLKADNPDLTVDEFKAQVKAMHTAGEVKLEQYTRAQADIMDDKGNYQPEAIQSDGSEPYWFVHESTPDWKQRTSEEAERKPVPKADSAFAKRVKGAVEAVPAFKGSQVDVDDNAKTATVTTPSGHSVTIHFEADEKIDKLQRKARGKQVGRRGKGAYVYSKTDSGKDAKGSGIYLRTGASHETFNHEAVHWMEDIGLISQEEVAKYGGREGVAKAYAAWVASGKAEANSLFDRIWEFLDALLGGTGKVFKEITERTQEPKLGIKATDKVKTAEPVEQTRLDAGFPVWEMTKAEFDEYVEMNGNPLRTQAHDDADFYEEAVNRALEQQRRNKQRAKAWLTFEQMAKDLQLPDDTTYWEVIQRGRQIPVPTHEEAVKRALADGKPVPKRVLADYPDLQPASQATDTMSVTEPAAPSIGKKEAGDNSPEVRIERSAQAADVQARKDEGGQGLAVGAENISYRWKADALRVFLQEVRKGRSVDEAAAEAKKQAREWIERHNARRPKDINWKRWEGSADNDIDTAVRMMVHAEKTPTIGKKADEPKPQEIPRTTPRKGTPEREAIEKEYDEAKAESEAHSAATQAVRDEMERANRGTKKKETLSKRLGKMLDKGDPIQSRQRDAREAWYKAAIEDIAEQTDDLAAQLAARWWLSKDVSTRGTVSETTKAISDALSRQFGYVVANEESDFFGALPKEEDKAAFDAAVRQLAGDMMNAPMLPDEAKRLSGMLRAERLKRYIDNVVESLKADGIKDDEVLSKVKSLYSKDTIDEVAQKARQAKADAEKDAKAEVKSAAFVKAQMTDMFTGLETKGSSVDNAWEGNAFSDESQYLSDGAIIVDGEMLNSRDVATLRGRDNSRNQVRPRVKPESAKDLWNITAAQRGETATFLGVMGPNAFFEADGKLRAFDKDVVAYFARTGKVDSYAAVKSGQGVGLVGYAGEKPVYFVLERKEDAPIDVKRAKARNLTIGRQPESTDIVSVPAKGKRVSKAKEARTAASDAVVKAVQKSKSKPMMGVDPEVVGAVVKLLKAHLDVGAAQFADFVQYVVLQHSKEFATEIADYIERSWARLRQRPGFEHLDAAGKVEDVLNALADKVPPVVVTDGEPAPGTPDKAYGTKNAFTEEQRDKRGAPPVMKRPPVTYEEMVAEGRRLIATKAINPQTLMVTLQVSPRPISWQEGAALLVVYKTGLEQMDEISDRMAQAKEAGVDGMTAIVQAEHNAKLAEVDAVEEVLVSVGTEWSLAGHVRQIMVGPDFSIERLKKRLRDKQGGEALDEGQLEALKDITKKYADLQKKLEEIASKKTEADARKKIADDLKAAKSGMSPEEKKAAESAERKAAKAKKTAEKRAAAKAMAIKAVADLRKMLSNPTGRSYLPGVGPIDAIPAIVKVVKAYIELGAATLADVFARMRADGVVESVEDIRASFEAAWMSLMDSGDIESPMASIEDLEGLSRYAKKVMRALGRLGMTDVDEAVDATWAELKMFMPDISREQTIEAMSGYGLFKPLDRNELSDLVRKWSGILLQTSKLNDIKAGEVPARTGTEYPTPSDEERQKAQLVYETLKQSGLVATNPERQLKTPLDAAKTTVRNRITDLQTEIDNKEKIVQTRTSLKEDEELKDLRKRRDELQKAHDEMFKTALTDEQKAAIIEKALEREIAALEARITKHDYSPKLKGQKLSTPAIDAKRATVEALKAQIEELRAHDPSYIGEQADAENARRQKAPNDSPLSPWELATARRKILVRMEAMKKRIAAGDYAKPEKANREVDDETAELLYQMEQEKDRYRTLEKAAERRAMGPAKRALFQLEEAAAAQRAWVTAFDWSAVFRQGGIASWANPEMAVPATKRMAAAMVSEKTAIRLAENIRRRRNHRWYKAAKLAISSWNGRLSQQEEAFVGAWSHKIPGVRQSERGYVTYLNEMRAELFDKMFAQISGTPTLEQAKSIANYVNIATGRGSFGQFDQAAGHVAIVLFSPRFAWSRFQFASTLPFWTAAKGTKWIIAQQYMRYTAAMAAFYGAAGLYKLGKAAAMSAAGMDPDDEDEKVQFSFDLFDSDFGKIRIGNSRVDPMSGLLQTVRFAAAGAKGTYDTVAPWFGAGESREGNWDAAGRFLRSKLSPSASLFYDVVFKGEDFLGNKLTPGNPWDVLTRQSAPGSLLERLTVPMAVSDVSDLIKDRGPIETTGMSLLALAGMNSSVHDKGETGDLRKKLRKLEGDEAAKNSLEARVLRKHDKLMSDLQKLSDEQAAAGKSTDSDVTLYYKNGVARKALGRKDKFIYPYPAGAPDVPEEVDKVVTDHFAIAAKTASGIEDWNAAKPSSRASTAAAAHYLASLPDDVINEKVLPALTQKLKKGGAGWEAVDNARSRLRKHINMARGNPEWGTDDMSENPLDTED